MSPPQPATRIAACLAAAGTSVAFGVPGGGQNLDMVGALEAAGIRFVLAHGETAAAIMASTFGHLTGSPGAVVVTRGPGAASVANGAAQATLDRCPLIVITDAVASDQVDRVPHQRLDQRSLFAPVTKRTATIGPDSTEAEMATLLDCAMAEPPGAVHIDYDGSWRGSTGTNGSLGTTAPTRATEPGPTGAPGRSATGSVAAELVGSDDDGITRLISRLQQAANPLVIIGRAVTAQDAPPVRQAVERMGAPALTTYQAAGVLPSDHNLNAGLFTNGASERPIIEAADLIMAIGLDMVEPIPAAWTATAPVLSISPTPTVDPYLPIELEVVGPPGEVVEALPALDNRWPPNAATSHRTTTEQELRAEAKGFAPTALVDALSEFLPSPCVATVDAGAHFLAIMPLHPVTRPGDLLISNGLATMGYAVPAAIGAALARPGHPVVAMVGDGGLSMTLAELETISRLDLPITVVVFNDSALSLIELKQQEGHGGRAAVRYRPTDFRTIAEGMGLEATVANTRREFEAACRQGFGRPRLIDARIDPHQYQNLMRVTRG